MIKNLQIINIDGTKGIGKSTQIGVLMGKIQALDFPVKLHHLDDTIDSAISCTIGTKKFLKENPSGVVVNDGSIARMMVIELNKGVSQADVAEKYLQVLHDYEILNHQYGMVNFLLVLDDLKECDKRLIKRERFIGKIELGIRNHTDEKYIISGLRSFDTNTISKSLKFHVIETDSEDSILDIQDMIWEYIESDFDIKKPSI